MGVAPSVELALRARREPSESPAGRFAAASAWASPAFGGNLRAMAMRVLAGLALLAAACEGGSSPVASGSPHADHVERVELPGASAELRIGSSEAFLDGLDGGHEVFRAVRRGELAKLKGLVAEDRSLLQRRGHMGRTPLYAAVESGNVAMVEMLLEAGADPNARRERQDTPLFPAPNVAIVELLLKHGADLHARDFAQR